MSDFELTLGSNAIISPMSAKRNTLSEPLWGLRTELFPVEIELISCPLVRRLHFVHHGGPSYINTYISHSRLQHTFAVFSLAAYFCPDDLYLRVAALLHDIGHAPFSHSLEKIEGIDHHDFTANYIYSEQIRNVLLKHGFDPKIVLDYINGIIPNPLTNKNGLLSIDYLDNFNFIRAAYVENEISIIPNKVLGKLRLNGNYIETDLKTAELLAETIVLVNKWFCSKSNLGPNTILSSLVKKLTDNKVVSVSKLSGMADSQVEHLLFKNPLTSEEAYKLWYYPQDIKVAKYDGNHVPENAYITEVKRLYLEMPLVDGKPITEVSKKAKDLVDRATELLGKYIVYWV